ncbi:uncharacterized protein LOC128238248 isoform X3 [Mya arenaria]|uniref:uncharacterized protein LOC128238248 isoform X3 n=1 Tax=Mya arenaria TaxID=6604 RepID=UPI0022E4DD5E|nr:uncharacterized protein LOC128238248 isoform X3 [Mya arenaria]XP_052809912.1 uncharacterized protein LOC128238248 isoform X3 [Mya arenaria]
MSIFLVFDSDLTEIEKNIVLSQLEDVETKGNKVQVSQRKELMFQISMTLETILVKGFSLLQEFLVNFIRNDQGIQADDTIKKFVEESNITVVLATYLRDALGPVDHSVTEKDMEIDCNTGVDLELEAETMEDIYGNTYKRFAYCLFYPFLSAKYGLSTETVKHISEEFSFEKKFVETLRERLRKKIIHCISLGDDIFMKDGLKYVKQLANITLSQQYERIIDLEKITTTARNLFSALEKLLFEVESCLQKTIIGEVQISRRVPTILPLMKKELFRIDHVLMVGTVYDKIAIYVDVKSTRDTTPPDVNTNKLNESAAMNENVLDDENGTQAVKTKGFNKRKRKKRSMYNKKPLTTAQQIMKVLQKYEVTLTSSYVIEYVSNMLSAFANAQHKQPAKNLLLKPAPQPPVYGTGQPIQACDLDAEDMFREGTLGCFLSSGETVYAMTCAHVLFRYDQMDAVSQAYMYDAKDPNKLVLLGLNSPLHVIFQTSDAMFVDCALSQVNDDMKQNVNKKLRDTTNKTQSSEYYTGDRKCLLGERVYKYGARTGLTHGTIDSINLTPKSCVDGTDNDYLVWIESATDTTLPEGGLMTVHEVEGATASVEGECFAMNGDSGAVVLMKHFDKISFTTQDKRNTGNLVALSMVSCGDLKLKSDEDKTSKLVLTFQLDKAVSLLENKMNVQLKLE